jgi:hypothetical protein
MQILVKMAGAYSKPFDISLFWYYSIFGERWNIPSFTMEYSIFHDGIFHLSPHENILTIARINIHYLYTIEREMPNDLDKLLLC